MNLKAVSQLVVTKPQDMREVNQLRSKTYLQILEDHATVEPYRGSKAVMA